MCACVNASRDYLTSDYIVQCVKMMDVNVHLNKPNNNNITPPPPMSENNNKTTTTTTPSESMIKSVPKPFSIEALMSDSVPAKKRPSFVVHSWSNHETGVSPPSPNIGQHFVGNANMNTAVPFHSLDLERHEGSNHGSSHPEPRDSDSDGSLDMEYAEDLSNRSQREGERLIIISILS